MAALASYLDARANGGLWKLRIDDIDATRCKPAYAEQIKTCLQNFGLRWDGEATSQQIRAGDDGVYLKARCIWAFADIRNTPHHNKILACA